MVLLDGINVSEREIEFFNDSDEFSFEDDEFADLHDADDVSKHIDSSTIVVIDNLPAPKNALLSKLSVVVEKIIKKKAPSASIVNMELAQGEETGKGYALVQLETKEQADEVLQHVQAFPIEKERRLRLIPLREIEQYEHEPQQSKATDQQQQQYKEMDDLQWWLRDSQSRDQYALRHWDNVELYWNDPVNRKEHVYTREKWTEDRIDWSPLGSYLVTWHVKGIALWGGSNWKIQTSFKHTNPHFMDFSPRERYIVTANNDAEKNVIVWDVRTGKKLMAFTVDGQQLMQQWPLFRWSHDEKYFATISPNNTGITIVNTQSWKSQHTDIPNIQSFAWSPKSNMFGYWTPDTGTIPAKVAIMEVPKMNELRFKNYYGVTNISFLWNEEGTLLGAQVDRVKKKQKQQQQTGSSLVPSGSADQTLPDSTNIEVFRVGFKDIPVETIELREPLAHFAWEPQGDKFVIVYGDNAARRNVTVYSLEGDKYKDVGTLTEKNVDRCLWSPSGRFFVMYYSRSTSGVLEFWDSQDLKQPVNTGEHFMMTNAQWDPTGRYLATWVSSEQRHQDNGYVIWNLIGEVHNKQNLDKFWQFLWRPRPPTLLNDKQLKLIKKNLPKKRQQYMSEERNVKDRVQKEYQEQRQAVWDEFTEFEERLQREAQKDLSEREKLFGRDVLSTPEGDWERRIETVEEVVDVTEVEE